MKVCDTCNGLGSVADTKHKNSTIRCKDCGGTGKEIASAGGKKQKGKE